MQDILLTVLSVYDMSQKGVNKGVHLASGLQDKTEQLWSPVTQLTLFS